MPTTTTTKTTTTGTGATTTSTVTVTAPDKSSVEGASKSGHNDLELAAKCYPCGTNTTATAMCVCGGVEVQIKGAAPGMSTLCHCWACRRAHSAPLYQVIYWPTANFNEKTFELNGATDANVTITKGHELLVPSKGGDGYPNYQIGEEHPYISGAGRMICKGP